MRLRNHLILLMILSINFNCFSQPIKSKKSSIHINTFQETEIADNQPPSISFVSPKLVKGEPLTIKDENLTIICKVIDDSGIKTLFINAEPVQIAEDDIFATQITLEEGENEIAILAMDNLGNYIETNYLVIYEPEIIFRSIANEGKYYALIIGIDEYQDPSIDDLFNPVNDATKLRQVLIRDYTFEPQNVNLIKNARMEDIIVALDELSHKITSNDNLLLFYAGHGWWDEKAEIGYWLPSDAKQENKTAWFRNSTLCDYLKEIDTKHTLVIADACFGGSIFNTRSAFNEASKAVKMLYELPSRKAMTSGTYTEVPDRSAFAKFLVERLTDNQERYLSSEILFSSFRIAVMNNSDAVPQYGEIMHVGDQGGDFIFIRK